MLMAYYRMIRDGGKRHEMCLGIPMRIVAVDGDRARCEAGGIEREVNLFLLQPDRPGIGDFVLVHVGFAIQTIRPDAARTAWEVHDAMQRLGRDDA